MSPEVTAAIIAVSGVVLTVIATVAVQISGRRATSRDTQKALEEQREQLNTTLAAQHEQLDRTLAEQRTRTLNERFATAAGQLGGDKPPAVRLAGVYAMSGLADDWPENRQTCADVLCAYLRLPYAPDPGNDASVQEQLDFRASREVRHTVIRVIAAHLSDGAAMSWQGLSFDFNGVVFDGGDFRGAAFSGATVSFVDAAFSGGDVAFTNAAFSGGQVSFNHAAFSGSAVSFYGASFSGGTVDFHAEFTGGEVNFSEPGDWSFPPAFPWTDTPAPAVKLPQNEDQP
jgi:pentapeptide repeat protein